MKKVKNSQVGWANSIEKGNRGLLNGMKEMLAGSLNMQAT